MEEQVSAPDQFRFDMSDIISDSTPADGASHAAGTSTGVGGGVSGGVGGARYKLMSPAKLPISRSSCITIPPGLSPTSFLESPVLLSNVKAEPSPTTGSLAKLRPVHYNTTGSSAYLANMATHNAFDERRSGGFEFRFPSQSNPTSINFKAPADLNNKRIEQQQQPVQNQAEGQSMSFAPLVKNEAIVSSTELIIPVPAPSHNTVTSRTGSPVEVDTDEFNHQTGGPFGNGTHASSQSEHVVSAPLTTSSSDDGYNWRKYGQKHVKGCEFPRSYYKCTHPNCEVKKLFERSHDGQITEIIYKGTHDHPKPQPSRRYSSGNIMSSSQDDKSDKVSSLTGRDGNGNGNGMFGHASHTVEQYGSGTPEQYAVDDSREGVASSRISDDIDDDDPFSKRRKMEEGVEITPIVKPIREPRVVVQTLSEVDILDDGYRWRKYGQKVVRGNPNPRSYYKCTSVGCPVRKHVERASHDPKAVITTYEGKHNHDVPTARTSSHDTAGPTTTTNAGSSRFIRSDQNNVVSLDLGVGINCNTENRLNEQQQQQQQVHPVGLVVYTQQQQQTIGSRYGLVQPNPVTSYYGGVNQYESREEVRNGGEMIPVSHSSYSYPQTIGRIQTGP